MNRMGRPAAWLGGLTLAVCVMLVPALSGAQNDNNNNNRDRADAAAPPAFQNLNLTEEQTQQLQRTLQDKNEQLMEALQNFHASHMRAVALEAGMLAAIEGTLTEQQREQFRQIHRRKAEAAGVPKQAPNAGQQNQGDVRQEQPAPQQAEPQDVPQRQPQDRQVQPQRRRADFRARAVQPPRLERDITIIGIDVTAPDEELKELRLSPQQQRRGEAVKAAYMRELQSTWQQIAQLHRQLVQLEAERLTAVEEILTDEQLEKLREARRQLGLEPEVNDVDVEDENDNNDDNENN